MPTENEMDSMNEECVYEQQVWSLPIKPSSSNLIFMCQAAVCVSLWVKFSISWTANWIRSVCSRSALFHACCSQRRCWYVSLSALCMHIAASNKIIRAFLVLGLFNDAFSTESWISQRSTLRFGLKLAPLCPLLIPQHPCTLSARSSDQKRLILMTVSMEWDYVSELLPTTDLLFITQVKYEHENHGGMTSTEENSWFLHQSSLAVIPT
jgi:hypothetical protein